MTDRTTRATSSEMKTPMAAEWKEGRYDRLEAAEARCAALDEAVMRINAEHLDDVQRLTRERDEQRCRADDMAAEVERLTFERDMAMEQLRRAHDEVQRLTKARDEARRESARMAREGLNAVNDAIRERDEAERHTANRIAWWLERTYGDAGMVGRIAVRVRAGEWRDGGQK